MTKIVIKTDRNDFQVSPDVLQYLVECNSVLLIKEDVTEDNDIDTLLYCDDCGLYFDGKYIYDMYYNHINNVRCHPDLVNAVEYCGDKSSYYNNIKVVEIPDDVEWFIDRREDYGDRIFEKCRIWE